MPELAVSAPVFGMSKKKATDHPHLNLPIKGEEYKGTMSIPRPWWEGLGRGELLQKNTIGVLVNTIRLSELNKILSGEYRKEHHSVLWDKGRWKSLEVYLVNRDKLMITNSILVKDAVLKQIVNTLPVVTGLTTKREMAGFYKDYRGIVVAGASKSIPPLGWLLVAEIDEDEILSFMKLMLMSAPIPAGIIIIVGILLFITFLRK